MPGLTDATPRQAPPTVIPSSGLRHCTAEPESKDASPRTLLRDWEPKTPPPLSFPRKRESRGGGKVRRES